MPYDQTGTGAISGAFLIDEATGALDQALYGDPTDTDTLANLDAEVEFDANSAALNDIVNDNELPEPAAFSLAALGSVGLLACRRRNVHPYF